MDGDWRVYRRELSRGITGMIFLSTIAVFYFFQIMHLFRSKIASLTIKSQDNVLNLKEG